MSLFISSSRMMKWLKLILFIGFLLVVHIGLLKLFHKIMDDHKIVNRHKYFERTIQQNPKFEFLGLGDSHLYRSLSRCCMNISYVSWDSPGEGYIQNYYRLKYYLEHYEHPRYLVIPLDLHSLKDRTVFHHHFYYVRFIDYFELYQITGDFNYNLEYFKANYIPFFDKQSALLDWWVKNEPLWIRKIKDLHHTRPEARKPRKELNLDESASKFQVNIAKDLPVDDIFRDTLQNISNVYTKSDIRYAQALEKIRVQLKSGLENDVLFHYFEKILGLCEKNDIQVILLNFPVMEEYFTIVDKHVDLHKYYQRVDSVLNRYENDTVINFRHFFRDHQLIFSDADHVNRLGSYVFSNLFNRIFTNEMNFYTIGDTLDYNNSHNSMMMLGWDHYLINKEYFDYVWDDHKPYCVFKYQPAPLEDEELKLYVNAKSSGNQEIVIRVNDSVIGSLNLEKKFNEYYLPLESDLLRENELNYIQFDLSKCSPEKISLNKCIALKELAILQDNGSN